MKNENGERPGGLPLGKGTVKHTEVLEVAGELVPPTPGRVRRVKLATVKQVRIELAAVYRRLDAGLLEPTEATRRAYCLRQVADLIEMGELETRLEALEERQLQLRSPRVTARLR